MTADHLSYKRASGVCLIGLAIQFVLALVMLLYGRLGQDPAGIVGAMPMLLGLPVWASLALVFHQHRLERLEALEAEAYRASSAAQASVFEEAGADQQVQAGKLAWMHKWFLPFVGLFYGIVMTGLGVMFFIRSRAVISHVTDYKPPAEQGWAIAIGVGIAVIGFIFARFVAGMAKQKVWALLHAGSAAAVGAALVGAALALAHFVLAAVKKPELIEYLPVVLAGFTAALGAESILNFILNLYRPRRAGEYQRPAFDSRVLAFIAAPDRLAASISEAINYQFGFDVSSTWFYRLLARSVGSLVALGLLTMWALSIFVVVRPNETGLLLVNGTLRRTVEPGLVVKHPWPFASVITFPSSAATTLTIGSAAPAGDGPILWTTEHSADEKEKLFLLQPDRAEGATPGGADRPGDLVLIAAEFPVQYRVRDLEKYLSLAQDGAGENRDKVRQDLLTAVASGIIIRHVATRSLSEMLGPERAEIAAEVKRLVQAEFDRLESGAEVIFVGLAGVHPEQSVAPAFEAVVRKDQARETELEKSRAYSIRTLASVAGEVGRARAILAELDRLDALKASGAPEPARAEQERVILDKIVEAGGEAASLISRAKAYRWERHMKERARVVRSRGQIASYRAAPLVYRMTQFTEALRSMAEGRRVIITAFPDLRIDLNKEETEPNISGLAPTTETKK